MTLKYLDTVPYQGDLEVRAAAVRIFQDSRSTIGVSSRGNDTLRHCERVAVALLRSYTTMDNQGGREYALLYAKVADMFGALWYFSSGAQSRIQYRALRAELFQEA